jgi:hypothetical protein
VLGVVFSPEKQIQERLKEGSKMCNDLLQGSTQISLNLYKQEGALTTTLKLVIKKANKWLLLKDLIINRLLLEISISKKGHKILEEFYIHNQIII